MRDKAKFLGHPVHPMLIVFPLGLLPVSVVFDFVYLGTKNVMWSQISYWILVLGIVGGLLAAAFGIHDWLTIPHGTRAKRVGLLHGATNVVAVGAFALSWWLRRAVPYAPTLPYVLIGVIGLFVALLGAWLGGELVYRLGVGIDENADVNAPNSLAKPAVSQDTTAHL